MPIHALTGVLAARLDEIVLPAASRASIARSCEGTQTGLRVSDVVALKVSV
jgi:hypothetical protein